MRNLAGDEEEVLFSPGDAFRGVQADWLIPRLRLDPRRSPVDLTVTLMNITVDGELIEDVDEHTSIFGRDGQKVSLASFSDGPAGMIGGSLTLLGDWTHFHAYEIANRYTWVGPRADRGHLVRSFLSTDARYWKPQPDQEYHFESPYLDSQIPADRRFALDLAAKADSVILNGTRVTGE